MKNLEKKYTEDVQTVYDWNNEIICANCGEILEDQIQCKKCGHRVEIEFDGWGFSERYWMFMKNQENKKEQK